MIVIDWILTTHCNLNCFYCLQGSDTRREPCNPVDISFLPSVEPNKFLFHLTGGEPFLVPNFTEICQAVISSGNLLSINTNLTISPEQLTDVINPRDIVYINASVHYPYRSKSMKAYALNFNTLRHSDYFVVGSCVMIPELFDEVATFIDNVRHDYNITLFPKLMRGISGGRLYPKNYTDHQLAEITRLTAIAEKEAKGRDITKYQLLSRFSPSIDTWRADDIDTANVTLCFDGESRIHLDTNGDWIVCGGRTIGNVYSDGVPQSAPVISCHHKVVCGDKQFCKISRRS